MRVSIFISKCNRYPFGDQSQEVQPRGKIEKRGRRITWKGWRNLGNNLTTAVCPQTKLQIHKHPGARPMTYSEHAQLVEGYKSHGHVRANEVPLCKECVFMMVKLTWPSENGELCYSAHLAGGPFQGAQLWRNIKCHSKWQQVMSSPEEAIISLVTWLCYFGGLTLAPVCIRAGRSLNIVWKLVFPLPHMTLSCSWPDL